MTKRTKPAPCVEPPVYVTSGSTRKVHRLRTDGDSKCGLLGDYYRKQGRTLNGREITIEDASHRRQVCINCFPDGLNPQPTPDALLLEAREYAEHMYALAQSYLTKYGGGLKAKPPWFMIDGGVEIGKEEGIEDE